VPETLFVHRAASVACEAPVMRGIFSGFAEIALLLVGAGVVLLGPHTTSYDTDVPRMVGRAWAYATNPTSLGECPRPAQSFWMGCTDVATSPKAVKAEAPHGSAG
jgi:hypothetical protein